MKVKGDLHQNQTLSTNKNRDKENGEFPKWENKTANLHVVYLIRKMLLSVTGKETSLLFLLFNGATFSGKM